jgi:hypothetical protein
MVPLLAHIAHSLGARAMVFASESASFDLLAIHILLAMPRGEFRRRNSADSSRDGTSVYARSSAILFARSAWQLAGSRWGRVRCFCRSMQARVATHYKFNVKNYIVEMSMILNLSLKAVCNECLFFDLIFKHQTLYIKVLIKIIYFEFLKRPYFNSDIGNVYLNFQENLKN